MRAMKLSDKTKDGVSWYATVFFGGCYVAVILIDALGLWNAYQHHDTHQMIVIAVLGVLFIGNGVLFGRTAKVNVESRAILARAMSILDMSNGMREKFKEDYDRVAAEALEHGVVFPQLEWPKAN